RIITTWREDGDGHTRLVSSNAYDHVGRLIGSMDPLGQVTTYSEVYTNGFTVLTTTYPDASTRIERRYLDGRLESVSGTSAHPLRYEYGAYAGYRTTTEYKLGDLGSTNEWVMTLSDGMGREVESVYPDGAFSLKTYDSR